MTVNVPSDTPSTAPFRAWGRCVAVSALLALSAGWATLSLAPPLVDRDTAVWLAAGAGAGAGLGGAGLAVAWLAWGALRRHERELRRQQVIAGWRIDAAHDDSLDDDADALDKADSIPSVADLRAALDAVEDAVVLLDPDGWVMAVNPAATALLGVAVAPECRWDERVAWPAALMREQRALPGGGTVIIGRDPVRDRLRATQIDGMDAMAELAGVIAHDVNNALGAVAGYADFLVTDLPAQSPQADYAARILRATDRCRTMLRRTLAASRTAAPTLGPADAGRILSDAAALLRTTLPPGVGLSVREDLALPRLFGDAVLLTRTLVALGGALRLAAEPADAANVSGASLKLRAALWPAGADAVTAPPGWRVHAPLWPRRCPHLMLEVRGRGGPRSASALRCVLDPLLGAHDHTRLGDAEAPLAALSVARAHDGGLIAWTHPTEGTVLRLFVPLAPAVAAVAGEPSGGATAMSPWHVLVVDGDQAMGDRLSIGLERLGCEVAVCESAEEALEIVVDEPAFFDVVVAGPMAGGMTGWGLIARLKALRPDLPCVRYADPDDAAASEAPAVGEGGADLVLPTPVDIAGLSSAIAAFAATRRLPAPTVRR